MKIKSMVAAAAIVIAGTVGSLAASGPASATLTPVPVGPVHISGYEVVVTNPAGKWVYVNGPLTMLQADEQYRRLFASHLQVCRLHLPACANHLHEYALIGIH